MTDLEMTKLCAEAMGIEVMEPLAVQQAFGATGLVLSENPEVQYDPLHNDGQAMALVKRRKLDIEAMFSGDEGEWQASIWHVDGDRRVGKVLNADLNRAIVECVAKLQASLSGDASGQ